MLLPSLDNETHYKIALSAASGIGGILFKQLVNYCGSAEAVFRSSKGRLQKIPGIGPHTAATIQSGTLLKRAEEILKKAEEEDVNILFFTDSGFPKRLKDIYDGPAVLYQKGPADLHARKTVAVVGTRQSTIYGKKVTSELIEGLKNHKPLIISGLAYGIDITAHSEALRQGLETAAVVANGLDIVYPAAHKKTAKEIEEKGALLTEYTFGEKPDAPRFPARNRIISGLADAVIVVEAAATGGALITAEIANSYNKEVFAVPGKTDMPYSEGCNSLIKRHKAHIITTVKDLEYIMNWEKSDVNKTDEKAIDISTLSPDEIKVFEILTRFENLAIDKIVQLTGLPAGKLAAAMLSLELSGFIRSLPGKIYSVSK